MLKLTTPHHAAIICSDYQVSKKFYTEVLGLDIISEVYRSERQSYKLDLKVGENFQIELFSFPNPPARVSHPEAAGLRHLAFAVSNLDEAIKHLTSHQVETEPVRVDEITGKRFTFFADPDLLPLELYEM
ncbi:SMU1112c/YaeR family gloxylase I-like metalloprotein [Pararcticibacter amylolyticus]|uniref:VOC family protein n=1 Tax=Pararcticibacter amylolyticus TaxID=2173175 RepID=A0A2U2PHU5_9SPHI|nr:VOC family protein [Pararcticibacter amylolyticus]PWG80834.1 VOC family protein [Pararcticibacter amylolyticus]